VPSNRPTAVVINKRCFIFHSPLSLIPKSENQRVQECTVPRGEHSTFAPMEPSSHRAGHSKFAERKGGEALSQGRGSIRMRRWL
jgi:hypothetical protein